MAVLDEYILRAARLLSDAADEDVDALCREIMQVFDLDYTNPEALKYINSSSSFRYSKSDLGMILQKLRLKREDSDDKACRCRILRNYNAAYQETGASS